MVCRHDENNFQDYDNDDYVCDDDDNDDDMMMMMVLHTKEGPGIAYPLQKS